MNIWYTRSQKINFLKFPLMFWYDPTPILFVKKLFDFVEKKFSRAPRNVFIAWLLSRPCTYTIHILCVPSQFSISFVLHSRIFYVIVCTCLACSGYYTYSEYGRWMDRWNGPNSWELQTLLVLPYIIWNL